MYIYDLYIIDEVEETLVEKQSHGEVILSKVNF